MRKLIVKHLALAYRIKLFGKINMTPRCATVIIPYFLVMMVSHLHNPGIVSLLDIILIAGFGLLMWFCMPFPWVGLSYFDFFPLKWEELDDMQKFDFGDDPTNHLTDGQYDEWIVLYKKYQ